MPGGSDNISFAGIANFVKQYSQSFLLVFFLDASGNADVVDGWHIDQIAPWKADVIGDAGTLGSQRILGNLDQNLLALL